MVCPKAPDNPCNWGLDIYEICFRSQKNTKQKCPKYSLLSVSWGIYLETSPNVLASVYRLSTEHMGMGPSFDEETFIQRCNLLCWTWVKVEGYNSATSSISVLKVSTCFLAIKHGLLEIFHLQMLFPARNLRNLQHLVPGCPCHVWKTRTTQVLFRQRVADQVLGSELSPQLDLLGISTIAAILKI